MDECCRIDGRAEMPSVAPGTCPRCGTLGRPIAELTVRSILQPDALQTLQTGEPLRFCPNPQCAVLYFDGGGRVAGKEKATVRVGFKETEDPRPLCYCFGFSVGGVRAEIESTGRTLIPERIKEGVKAGRCACEVKNPKGVCCLGDVKQAVKGGAR